jgi:co-chaperonin GroES (HSP10)
MVAPVNNLIVTIEQKFYDSVTFASGQTIYFDPSWHPEEYAMLRAKVVSIPTGIIKRYDYEGVTVDMKPGDEIYMRYDVVFAYKNQPDRDTPIYKNLLFQYNEKTGRYEEFWLCDILQTFAIIRDRIIMVNGYVMLDPVIESREDYSSLIIRPDNLKAVELKEKAVIRQIGSNSLGLTNGDTVYVNPSTVMCYTINTEKFYLIKQRNILAKVN